MKIGLFGGTFNPFHNGHVGIIVQVKKSLALDKIFLIPSSTPPHKPNINLAPAGDRFEMVKASIKGLKGFFVSDKELKRKGPSFTMDTINEFRQEYGISTEFYLLMGSDAFLDITTWNRKDQIFEAIPVVIMLRGNFKNHDRIASFIDETISKGYTFNQQDTTFFHPAKQQIIVCKVPRIDISSTMIRERIKRRESIKGLVPEGVEKIIHTKELYQ